MYSRWSWSNVTNAAGSFGVPAETWHLSIYLDTPSVPTNSRYFYGLGVRDKFMTVLFSASSRSRIGKETLASITSLLASRRVSLSISTSHYGESIQLLIAAFDYWSNFLGWVKYSTACIRFKRCGKKLALCDLNREVSRGGSWFGRKSEPTSQMGWTVLKMRGHGIYMRDQGMGLWRVVRYMAV